MGEHGIPERLARLREGAPPRVLDLFSGCGGISLGFSAAGFKIAAAVERDPQAALSHASNFHKTAKPEDFAIHSRARDITELTPDDLCRALNLGEKLMAADVIVGGPPCQAFARVGRSKLREVAADPLAFISDLRSALYLQYLAWVREFKPLAIVMENVPDMMNFGKRNIPEEMCEVLDDDGYTCSYTLLNAVHYGVPQFRERLFLIAYRKELGIHPEFPLASHSYELPRGYLSSRHVALKHLNLAKAQGHFVPTPGAAKDAVNAITVKEAISDLPLLTDHLDGRDAAGPRRFGKKIAYRRDAELSSFARRIREWPGFEAADGVCDHVIRRLPRDYMIFRHMKEGDQYPEAIEIAKELAKAGAIPSVPPYDPTKFPNKWRKLEQGQPARTLMAHLSKDSYSHIHYASEQARTISVREAARLQSFPDGFIFVGAMNSAFRQIGNAVPPLLAFAVANVVKTALDTAAQHAFHHRPGQLTTAADLRNTGMSEINPQKIICGAV